MYVKLLDLTVKLFNQTVFNLCYNDINSFICEFLKKNCRLCNLIFNLI